MKVPQNNAGAIANQAFSGFTINSELIAGDKPDPVNFIDSETGSMDVSRQAVSQMFLQVQPYLFMNGYFVVVAPFCLAHF